jgi:hypothetical protein
MVAMVTPRKGMVVEVVFLDHSMNMEHAPEFTAYGRVSKVTRTTLIIDTWHYTDAGIPRDTNVESFSLVRSAIKKITPLVPKSSK